MSEWSEQEVQKTLAAVVKRASTDPGYRALALRDAGAAVAAVNPIQIPQDFKIRFVDNAGANMTVVLPDPLPEGELSDDLLEYVSGGGGVVRGREGGLVK
jgi:hypothetical protein